MDDAGSRRGMPAGRGLAGTSPCVARSQVTNGVDPAEAIGMGEGPASGMHGILTGHVSIAFDAHGTVKGRFEGIGCFGGRPPVVGTGLKGFEAGMAADVFCPTDGRAHGAAPPRRRGSNREGRGTGEWTWGCRVGQRGKGGLAAAASSQAFAGFVFFVAIQAVARDGSG